MDMQVTFDSGLETLGERLAGRKGSKDRGDAVAGVREAAQVSRHPAPSAPVVRSHQLLDALAGMASSHVRSDATQQRLFGISRNLAAHMPEAQSDACCKVELEEVTPRCKWS